MSQTTRDRIEQILQRQFTPLHLEVIDHSEAHRGHPGAATGGHFQVLIVSERFNGLSRLEAQRMVHESLACELHTAVHALQLTAWSPKRWRAANHSASQPRDT